MPGFLIRRIRDEEELASNEFKNWFAKTEIQWEQSFSNISAQNDVVERKMYTVIELLRIILKEYTISIDLWNLFLERVIYILNRLISKSVDKTVDERADDITSFEAVNEVSSNVSHLKTLDCRVYMHVSKLFSRQKMNDRFWKEIFVEYNSENQWKIYDPRTKRIHLTRDVKFDEMYSYYQNDSESSRCLEIRDENEYELEEFWTSKNDMFLRKFYENVSKRDENSFANSDDYFTSQSNFDDENDSFNEASDEAFDEVFDENENDAFDEAFDDNENLQDISQIAFKRRMTSSSSSFSDRATRSSRDEASRSDYAKLHDSRKRTRNSTRNSNDDNANIIENIIESESIIESINYSWNFILNSHVHMIRVFRALASENILRLTRHSKSQSLKEAKASSNWMHWKIAMTVEVEHLIKADTYELIKSSSNRKVIIDRWVFRLKSDVHDNIVRYKARWVIHEYKQQKEIDFTVI